MLLIGRGLRAGQEPVERRPVYIYEIKIGASALHSMSDNGGGAPESDNENRALAGI
jgi:hypothetical protein